MAGCVHQSEAGLLLLFSAGQHRRADFVGKYSDALAKQLRRRRTWRE